MTTVFMTAALAFFAAACQSTHRVPGSDDAMMATLTPEQRVRVDAARATYSLRTDELAVARLDVVRARAELVLANTDRDIARANVVRARNVVAIAETNSTDDLTAARDALAAILEREPEYDRLVEWQERSLVRAERAEALAEASQAVAHATTDLEKARAFAVSDRAAAEGVDVLGYEETLNEYRTREASATAELAGAERDVELAERSYEEARAPKPLSE